MIFLQLIKLPESRNFIVKTLKKPVFEKIDFTYLEKCDVNVLMKYKSDIDSENDTPEKPADIATR